MPPVNIVKRTLQNQSTKNNLLDSDEIVNRIVIFATNNGLHHLSNSSIWYMDGNFGLAPKDFLQQYVKTYEKMLTKILEILYPDPTSFHVDFEKSVINAVKSVLGEHIEDESFSEFCRKLDGLAFLPLEVVKVGMAHFMDIMPGYNCNANELVDYFDKSFVNETYRQIGIPGETNLRFRNCPPLFPLEQ
ncbi:hypothetical protein AGLY_012105 [Aphis glycines]|uniref:Uncharacterized protein n=1 Tax=Aphis glycines TaxID=307491 RepID=A0A6G0TBB7_APHGL|nr:hypothetical protein AGLY_012105 [Aphis glycines]